MWNGHAWEEHNGFLETLQNVHLEMFSKVINGAIANVRVFIFAGDLIGESVTKQKSHEPKGLSLK